MNELIVISAFALTAFSVFVTNWLALMPWRRTKDKHWSEQARLAYPVIVAARSNLWTVPGIFVLTVLLAWPDSSPLWLLTGIASVLGGYAGTFPLDHELFPRISFHEFLRQAAIGILFRFLIWFVFLGAAVLMPDTFNLLGFAIGCGVVGLWVIWSKEVWSGWAETWSVRASTGTFAENCRRYVGPDECNFSRSLVDAFPIGTGIRDARARKLLFTERLLELLSDDEVAAVCAHELAHLTESKADRYSRSVQILAFLPWIYFKGLS